MSGVSDCAVPRFYNALLGALALHGLLLLARSRHTVESRQVPERAAEQWIDIDDLPPSAPNPTEPALAGSEPASAATGAVAMNDLPSAAPASRGARAEPRLASSAELPAVPDAAPSDDGAATGVAARAGTGEAAASEPERKIDLGLDGHFFLGPQNELGPRLHKADVKPKPDPQKRLENALAADDVQRGMARGNALVGSLNAAARADGPTRGEALFRVTVGADGGVLSAELVRGSGSDWSAALSSFRALAAQKRLRVPPGARGLRVTFSVKAKVQRPSGKDVEAAPVDLAQPSFTHPNGLVPHGDFDLADLGGSAQRLVYARVVSEEVL